MITEVSLRYRVPREPRHIIQMMCALVDPKLGDEICDPACGTGGFLLGAFQHILTQHTSRKLRLRGRCVRREIGMG